MTIRAHRRSGATTLLLFALINAGCSGSSDDTGSSSDLDQSPDAEASTPDAGADQTVDVAAESSQEAATDASPDTTADSVADSAIDVTPDTSTDAGTDASSDAAMDGAPDSSPDTLMDSAVSDTLSDGSPLDAVQIDSPADSASDATVDSAVDAAAVDASVPFTHCLAPAAMPSWAEKGINGHDLVVHASALDLYLSAMDQGLIRLVYAGKGQNPAHQSWTISTYSKDPSAFVSGSAGGVQLCGPQLGAEVDSQGRIRVWDQNGADVLQDGSKGGYATGQEDVDGVSTAKTVITRASPSDESFYGFGERTGPLERRGQRMTFWNTDAYQSAYGGYPPDADPMYQSIPFYMGMRQSKAYGVFTDNTYRMRIDAAKTDPEHLTLESFGGFVDQFIIPGPSMREVIRRYTALTGHHPLPPRWSLGFHQSRWGYPDGSTFEQIAQSFRDRKIPMDTMWLDIQHMDGFRSFTWDNNAFPDPAGMISRLNSKGVKVVTIVDPGIKQDPGWDIYVSGNAANHFLKTPSQELYTGKVWAGVCVFPDFSSASTASWWADLASRPVAKGVSGLWIDMNEPAVFDVGTTPINLPVAGGGTPTTMAEFHNAFALKEAEATYTGLKKTAPDKRPFILTRAGYAGIQNYAAVWTGDSPSSWTTLRQVFPMLLNLGLSGVAFVGSDVGGYSGNATAELFARWMAVGSFSPFFRNHVTSGVPSQEPWVFGTEVEDVSRAVIQERYELLPYLYSLFAQNSTSGEPILRPMVYEFQDDSAGADLDDQAMFGPFILVAPVMTQGVVSRTVYLPAGRWFEAKSGAIFDGPTTVTVGLTLASLPTFIRDGAIIPRGPTMQWSNEKPMDPLFLDIYPSTQSSSFDFYEDEGDGFAYQQSKGSKITYLA